MPRFPLRIPNFAASVYRLLTWQFWQDAVDSMPTGGNEERERWHLYQLHGTHLQELAASVAKRCSARSGCQVGIQADSVWVDAKVYADFTLPSKPTLSTELADLLIDVDVSYGGHAAFRKAGLVQGKSTRACMRFDSGCTNVGGISPTNKERDLLEAHTGPVALHASGRGDGSKGRNRTQIPATGTNVFDVSIDPPGVHGQPFQLIDYAVYLLFPKKRPPKTDCSPYQVLTPLGRTHRVGSCRDYEDWLADLADPHSTIPEVRTRPKWGELLDAVSTWAHDRQLKDGTFRKVQEDIPFVSQSTAVACLTFASVSSNLSSAYNRASLASMRFFHYWWHRSTIFNARETPPPSPPSEEGPKGFWYVQMRVDYDTIETPSTPRIAVRK